MPAEVTTEHAWLNHPHEIILNYNKRDVVATIRSAKAIRVVLEKNHQYKFYREVIWPTVFPTMRMQARGLPYDSHGKSIYRRKLRAELGETDAEIRSHFARTYSNPEAINAFIWQVCAWSAPELGLEGWFGTKPKVLARRKEPFTKSELGKLLRHTSDGFNPASRDQLREWLFGDDGLRLRRPTARQFLTEKGRKVSVDQQTLNHLLQRRPRNKAEEKQTAAAIPIIHLLMHRARLQKIDQDYLDPEVRYGIPNIVHPAAPVAASPLGGVALVVGKVAACPSADADNGCEKRVGRVFPRIKILGTESGRYAYAEPPVHSWPDEIRHLVAAPPGRKIVGADFSAIESRVFSKLTGDKADQHLFEQSRLHPDDKHFDIHINTFNDFFGWTFDQFMAQESIAQKASRNYAKVIRYGVFQYGGEPESVRSKVYCPCPKCAAKAPPVLEVTPERRITATQRWFNKHPSVAFWRANISKQLATTKWLTNPFGRRRYFAAPFSKEQEREGWAWMVSSTATDIIQRAMMILDAESAPLILQHHDALYLESPDSEVPHWSARLKAVMERSVPELDNMIFPVTVGVGASWADLH